MIPDIFPLDSYLIPRKLVSFNVDGGSIGLSKYSTLTSAYNQVVNFLRDFIDHDETISYSLNAHVESVNDEPRPFVVGNLEIVTKNKRLDIEFKIYGLKSLSSARSMVEQLYRYTPVR